MKLELQKGSRSRLLAALLLIIAAIFVMRLFYLQIIQHDYYKALADEQQIKPLTIPAKRGLIYSLDAGQPVPLVLNETVYTVFADPAIVTEPDRVVEVVRNVAGGNARSNFTELLKLTQTRYQVLATQLTRVQANLIKKENLHGIGFQANSQRVYPEKNLASQVLGFVDGDGEGQYGIESASNDELKGVDGLLRSVTDVNDVPLTIGDRNINQPAVDGKNIVLSIDRNIQQKARQALVDGLKRTGATNASLVVLDPQTGRVMAMANLPDYNPAEYSEVENVALFNNTTISKPYETGSNIKPFTMATGVDKGVVKASDTFINTDSIRIEDQTITNFYRGITGEITFQTALEWSLNTGFVTVAQRLGDGKNITEEARQTMYEYFHDRFGLGKLTGIELANEQAGVIISPEEQEGNAVRYSNMAFGQGMDVTMIQVAAGFNAIINGGNYYKPTIVAGEVTTSGEFSENKIADPRRIIKESTSDHLRDMMLTARRSAFPGADKPGYKVGGKTGTAQVAEAGGYSQTDAIGSYIGFGGGKSSRYVIMVEVSGKGKAFGGAQDAMPIFTDMSNWLLDYLKIQPEE